MNININEEAPINGCHSSDSAFDDGNTMIYNVYVYVY